MRRALTVIGIVLFVVALGGAAYLGTVVWSTKTAAARLDGTVAGLHVESPVTIGRDDRGIPHIRAASAHDLFFAEGYAVGQDRLFQLDLLRRFTTGRLAEILGPPLAENDLQLRRWDVAGFATRAYAAAPPDERAMLEAFAEGVNAAAVREPLPPEFRALAYGFQPWQPQDAIACAMATVFDLIDDPQAVELRDRLVAELGPRGIDAFEPYSDPQYDAPTAGRGTRATPLPPLAGVHAPEPVAFVESREGWGSNAWAVGANHVDGGHAVVANDPHLRTSIPGVWWIVEAAAPGIHIAGATLVGVPGIVLGHNAHIAWGVTNGGTLTLHEARERARGDDEIFENGTWIHATHRRETIGVRFAGTRTLDVLTTPRGFVWSRSGDAVRLVSWPFLDHPRSLLTAFWGLARAGNVDDGLNALRAYEAPVQNFVVAGDDGRAGYRLGGAVIADPAGALTSATGDAATPPPASVPFDAMPHVPPSRDALVWTANNAMIGTGAPFRLAAFFAAPYWAWEIHRRLIAEDRERGGKMSPAEIGAIQADVASPAETELANETLAAIARKGLDDDASVRRVVAALKGFDGNIAPDSTGGSAAVALRIAGARALAADHLSGSTAKLWLADGPAATTLVRAVREHPAGWFRDNDVDTFLVRIARDAQSLLGAEVPPFGRWFAVPLKHPLADLGFRLWNGPTIVGHGGALAPAVQGRTAGQSFRALWIVGDWDRSTIDIPAGESGEPASPHYADLTAAWNRGERGVLPFSDDAVRAAARTVLTLRP